MDWKCRSTSAGLLLVLACADDVSGSGEEGATGTGTAEGGSSDGVSETGPSATTDAVTTDTTGSSTVTATGSTGDASDTRADTNETTTTGETSSSSTEGPTSSETGAICEEDEPEQHSSSGTALELPGLDCDDAALAGVSVLDTATGLDWWTFQGTDPDGGCEPDSVRITAMAEFQTSVCAFTEGCEATCTQGIPDGSTGCCGIDVVEFSVSCGPDDSDDSTAIVFLVGSGLETCYPVTFEYEF